MKKIVLTLCLAMMAGMMIAEEGYQAFGVQLGFAAPTFRLNSPAEYEEDRSKLTATPLNGVKIGLVYETNFVKGFGSVIGFNYSYGINPGKWEKLNGIKQSMEYPRTKSRIEDHIVELFVDWQYKFEIAQNTYVILYSGPTIQVHASLTETQYVQTSINTDADVKKRISSFNYEDEDVMRDYKRVNVTWGVGAGFQYDRYFIRGGYDFGLMNPYKMSNFNQINNPGTTTPMFTDRNTRGRLDGWQIKLGVYLWENK